ncbi:hypothetical protein KIL84_010974 [Mauremys mutica]|uniref:Uncharacterized protein n=1 Tax=Mauremys mutica TaxID=74926 RepID=A0A9D3XCX6_9SAUR|nr:hypothetical protein KIL84_010974 [Mauremys mutica]
MMAIAKKLMVKIKMARKRDPSIAVESRMVATNVHNGDGANDDDKDWSGAEEGGDRTKDGGDEGGNGGQDGIDEGGEETMTGITRKLMTVVEPRMSQDSCDEGGNDGCGAWDNRDNQGIDGNRAQDGKQQGR